MKPRRDRFARRVAYRARLIARRAALRFLRAGTGGAGNHWGWVDYEEVIYRIFEYQYWENAGNVIPLGNYYEFGVYRGGTFGMCYRTLRALARNLGFNDVKELGIRMYGFDSFEGLPEPKDSDRRTGWIKGAMAYGRDQFQQDMDRNGIPRDFYQLVQGYFENSLTPELRASLQDHKPSLVMMDCDMYSSTKTVLDWIRPLLRDGTFFVFDDIWSFMGHPDFGELRAIREFNATGPGLLVPHYFGGASQQVYVYTTGYQGEPYKEYVRSRQLAGNKDFFI
jgi:O-methyltransferase